MIGWATSEKPHERMEFAVHVLTEWTNAFASSYSYDSLPSQYRERIEDGVTSLIVDKPIDDMLSVLKSSDAGSQLIARIERELR